MISDQRAFAISSLCTAGRLGLAALLLTSALAPAETSRPVGDEAVAPDTTAVAEPGSSAVARLEVPRCDRVDVHYFHATLRCENCLTFEAYAGEALRTEFAEELDDGRLVWTVLNMDDESNAELVRAYDVFESSLVVSEVAAGVERDWKKLEAIWSLVGDKPAFLEYVAAEVDSALEAVSAYEPETETQQGSKDEE